MNFLQKTFVATFIATAVTGCGGKSKGTPSLPTTEPTQIGRFVDSAVEGLYYETETTSGFTGNNGEFEYKQGETVSFYLGDILLGSAEVAALLTPFDLVSDGDHSDKIQNIISLLQTFDEDANPDNGIVITSQTDDYISQFDIDINTPAELFVANETLQAIVRAQTNTGELVNAIDALRHFRETLLRESRIESEEVVLNLMNTKWQATLTTPECTDIDIYQLDFTIIGPISVGAHGVDPENCEPNRQAILGSTYEFNSLWACSAECTSNDLNRLAQTENGEALLQYIDGKLIIAEESEDGRQVITLTPR